MSPDRTPLQQAAKRVYEALCLAAEWAQNIPPLTSDQSEDHLARRVCDEIERIFQPLSHLMHEDDCE